MKLTFAALAASLALAPAAYAASITGVETEAGMGKIYITGEIVNNDDAALRNVNARMRAAGVLPFLIELDSPGGLVTPALKMADTIHWQVL